MTIQTPVQMDKSTFLAWAERQEENYEFFRGRVVPMTRSTRGHGLIVFNLLRALDQRTDGDIWSALPKFGVDVGPTTIRFPDIVIDRAGGARTDRTATAPVLIAEVLSPSSERIDLADKAAEYLALPSLATYLVVAQDEMKAWVWTRTATGFPAGPLVREGADAVIEIPALGLTLPLAELFRGVRLD